MPNTSNLIPKLTLDELNFLHPRAEQLIRDANQHHFLPSNTEEIQWIRTRTVLIPGLNLRIVTTAEPGQRLPMATLEHNLEGE
jgi:hypothetical protein